MHRDLKPSNVLVESNGRVQILDFGLVAEMQGATDLTQTRSGMFAGTPRYAAPEQMFGQRSEASDWYALGVMLYEALTGELPFTASDQMELLRLKQQEDPPQLAGRDDLPIGLEDLSQLVDGLIQREPLERLSPEAISELLQMDSETRTRGVSATAGSTGSRVSSDSQSSEMGQEDLDRLAAEEQELILVGREDQLDELNRQFSEFCESGQPRAVWIRGRSGEGKSSLAEAFLKPIRSERRAVIFSGRCYERESIPYKALDCWIDSLVSYLRRQEEEWLENALPEDITGLAQIFPVLNRVETIRQMPSIENPLMTAEKLRHRAFGALRDLLLAISKEQPVILFIDDLQWGDADSLAAFERIFSHEELPRLLFLGSYRSDERDASPFLNGWEQASGKLPEAAIDVKPLSQAEARRLIVRLQPAAEAVSDDELQRVYAESGGNPYFLWQLIEGFDREQSCFRPVPLQEMISERLDRLPSEARPLLEFLAVAGHDLATSEVELLSGLETKPYTALARMRNEKLIRLWGSGENQRLDVFHDKIRETVIEQLDESTNKAWHLQIGEAMERRAGMVGKTCEDFPPEDPFERVRQEPIPDLFDMARHFEAAGDSRAFDYHLLAGEQALRQNSNQEALEYLENAKCLVSGETPDAIKARVFYGVGEAHARCQDLAAAIKSLQVALSSATELDESIRIHYRLGNVYSSLGLVRDAERQFQEALELFGAPQPKSRFGLSWRFFRSLARILTNPIPRETNTTPQSRSRARIEARLFFRLGYCQIDIDSLKSGDSHFHSAVSGYATLDPILVTWAHGVAAVFLYGFGLPKLGKLVLNRAELAQFSSWPEDLATEMNCYLGLCHYFSGNLVEASKYFSDAKTAGHHCGDNDAIVFAPHLIRHCRMYTENASAELSAGKEVLRSAQAVGDTKGICWAHYDIGEALSRTGRTEEAAAKIGNASLS